MRHGITRSLLLIGGGLILLNGGFPTQLAADEPPAEQPNIVLIYADDQGWKDTGYQSDGVFQTPVLDRMARDGMVFTDAYTNAANCQPARACLLSGNYTPRHHVFAVSSTKPGARDEHFRTRPVSVIRKGDWKLHLYLEEWILDGGREAIETNNAVELYDLGKDLSEKTNLAREETAVRDELLDELLAWHERVEAPIPSKENP